MPTPDEHQALSRRRDELRQELAQVADLRQGSLSSRSAAANHAATAHRKETPDMDRTGR